MVSKVHIVGTKNNLKKIFGTINSISKEAIFSFEKGLIIIKCHDESQTAFLEMVVKKDYFQDFRIETPVEIGFNVERTFTVIGMCDETISMSINNGISIVSKGKFNIDALIPRIDVKREEIVIPDHSYTTSAILKIKYLIDTLSNTLQFSQFVEINTNEKIILKAFGTYGEHFIIDMPVEPLSTLNQKDKLIVVQGDIIKKMLSNFENQANVILNIDESLPAIELVYEEKNLHIRSLFSKCIGEK
jgi:hypothetical protein